MSTEQLIPTDGCRLPSFTEYAHQTWYDELVRMQNEDAWTNQSLFLDASFQRLCAESLIRDLSEKSYFQKFGGKTLEIVMVPTSEPYMYSVGLRITD